MDIYIYINIISWFLYQKNFQSTDVLQKHIHTLTDQKVPYKVCPCSNLTSYQNQKKKKKEKRKEKSTQTKPKKRERKAEWFEHEKANTQMIHVQLENWKNVWTFCPDYSDTSLSLPLSLTHTHMHTHTHVYSQYKYDLNTSCSIPKAKYHIILKKLSNACSPKISPHTHTVRMHAPRMHTHTHTHTHTHKHTHTHTHTHNRNMLQTWIGQYQISKVKHTKREKNRKEYYYFYKNNKTIFFNILTKMKQMNNN